MCPMRSANGPPTTAKMPGTDFTRARMSSRISWRERSLPPRSVRRKSTSNSAVETGTTWSPRSARPSRRPTFCTSGTESICSSMTSEMRFISCSEVPGPDVAAMSAVSSLKGGRKSFPILGYREKAANTATPSAAKTGQGCSSPTRSAVPCKIRFINRTTHESRSATAGLGFKSKEQRTGIKVRETRNDASMLTMVATAIGVNNFPSTPVSPSRGTKTKTTRSVA